MLRKGAYTKFANGSHYSYDTIIRQFVPGFGHVANITKYSSTTSKHQDVARVWECSYTVENIPMGTMDLSKFADNFKKREG